MKEDLVEILRCPVCRGKLTLTIRTKSAGEVETGSLACPKCPADYPIEDGIPNLLPPDERD
ncbi:MAG: methytransferase partner Trm112 [Thermoplasmata archaeon]